MVKNDEKHLKSVAPQKVILLDHPVTCLRNLYVSVSPCPFIAYHLDKGSSHFCSILCQCSVPELALLQRGLNKDIEGLL